ncbi:MAG: hypothetical protein AAB345_03950 [Patescibacteria group bacterium]
MNELIGISAALSFTIAFVLGLFTRKFLSLGISVLVGIGLSILTIALGLQTPNVQKSGLAIIVLIPVIIIIVSFVNLVAVLTGGVIGSWIGRKFRK